MCGGRRRRFRGKGGGGGYHLSDVAVSIFYMQHTNHKEMHVSSDSPSPSIYQSIIFCSLGAHDIASDESATKLAIFKSVCMTRPRL